MINRLLQRCENIWKCCPISLSSSNKLAYLKYMAENESLCNWWGWFSRSEVTMVWRTRFVTFHFTQVVIFAQHDKSQDIDKTKQHLSWFFPWELSPCIISINNINQRGKFLKKLRWLCQLIWQCKLAISMGFWSWHFER